jgi:hypothetical protein
MAQKPKSKGTAREAGDLRFETRNYAALGAALLSIALGFWLLSKGSITAAPLLLVLGYCVLVPYGLAAGRGRGPGGE